MLELNRVREELEQSAVKLGHAQAGGLYVRQASGAYALCTAYSDETNLQAYMEAHAHEVAVDESSAAGRAIATQQPVQVADVESEPSHRWPRTGFRTALVVP